MFVHMYEHMNDTHMLACSSKWDFISDVLNFLVSIHVMCDIIDADKLSLNEFYENYLQANQPCLFTNSITINWLCRKLWVTSEGKPDFAYLKETFGPALVPVADCKVRHYDSQLKKEMIFKDFIEYWERCISSETEDEECLYLKDWHFTKAFPNYDAYRLPNYFSSDWLNEFWSSRTDREDDYKFVYMGPKGTWTPFHADVFRSFSWSANICGCKRWIMCSPALSSKVLEANKKMPYDIFTILDEKEDGLIEVIQKPGEIIFVPSQWYHQVYNLDDTISINHNWFNASNIGIVWEFLKVSLNEVQQEIMDCREMEGWPKQCQILMKAVHGMDFKEFYQLLCVIKSKRILILDDVKKTQISDDIVEKHETIVNELDKDQNDALFETNVVQKDLQCLIALIQELEKTADLLMLDIKS